MFILSCPVNNHFSLFAPMWKQVRKHIRNNKPPLRGKFSAVSRSSRTSEAHFMARPWSSQVGYCISGGATDVPEHEFWCGDSWCEAFSGSWNTLRPRVSSVFSLQHVPKEYAELLSGHDMEIYWLKTAVLSVSLSAWSGAAENIDCVLRGPEMAFHGQWKVTAVHNSYIPTCQWDE